MGYQRMREWDVLWSPASTAHQAAEQGLRPGQLSSAVPGTQSICKKRRLPATLYRAYGDSAWDIMPRSYQIPFQVREWKTWLEAHKGAPENKLWILKTAQHLGKGLKLVRYQQAVKEVLVQHQKAEKAKAEGKSKEVRPFVLAQQYVDDPLLINGRKFGLRLWAVVAGSDPLRVYLHQGGLVLFSGQEYEGAGIADEEGQPMQAHVTNYAQNVHGDVWTLQQLEQHIGQQNYQDMMRRILRSTAMTYAAALKDMRSEAERLDIPPATTFELMGLDFLIDSKYRPWLLEVNSTPSLAVEHNDPVVEELIYNQKWSMVTDMFSLMRIPHRFSMNTPRPSALEAGTSPSWVKDEEAEMASIQNTIRSQCDEAFYDEKVCNMLMTLELEMRSRGGFTPLMDMMPWDAGQQGWDVPWNQRDWLARQWCRDRNRDMDMTVFTSL